MTSERTTFALPTRSVSALVKERAGKLSPVIIDGDEPQKFTIFDTFEHNVANRHVALLEVGGEFLLLSRNGALLTQTSKRGGDFVADLSEGPVRDALSHVTPLRSLLPLGQGEVQRTAVAFVDDEEKTQARASVMQLSGPDGDGIAIVGLSGLRGYDKALDRVRAEVEALGGTTLDASSVYARLLPGVTPFVSRPDVPLEADQTAFDTATAVIAAHLPLARVNEQGTIDDTDTEFLHHYRVSLRKIRSVISLFKGVYDPEQTASLKDRFSALMAKTGRLRDLDVYLLERDDFYGLVPETVHGGLDRMFKLFEAERSGELKKLRSHLRSDAYAAEMKSLEKLFNKRKSLKPGPSADRHALDYAAKLIWKRYRKICTIAQGITDATPDEEVHELRIQCKKLRYLMEFFQPLYSDKAIRSLIASLKKLQETLGNFNDFAVQQESLQAFLNTLDKSTDEALEIAQAVGALTAVLHRRQLEERDQVTGRFRQFNSPETQKSFRDLFHGGKA